MPSLLSYLVLSLHKSTWTEECGEGQVGPVLGAHSHPLLTVSPRCAQSHLPRCKSRRFRPTLPVRAKRTSPFLPIRVLPEPLLFFIPIGLWGSRCSQTSSYSRTRDHIWDADAWSTELERSGS